MSEPVHYIKRIEEKYANLGYGAYQWVLNEDPPPWQPLLKPLAEARLGLVATGGIYVTGQVAFSLQRRHVVSRHPHGCGHR